MVEAKVSARPEPTSPQPDVLLATKLALPKLRPGLVARSRLIDRLEQGLGHGVVAVVLPDTARRSCWPTGRGLVADGRLG
jgi:hypothetical protein